MYGVICFILGASVAGGGIAYAAGLTAEPSTHRVFVDGTEVALDGYLIDGHNYYQLRDVGEKVGFNVYWDDATRTVQIETGKPYTGEAPSEDDLDANLAIRKEMIDLINAVRKEHGLNEVAYSEKLMNAAQERAKICAETRSIGHDKELSTQILLKYEYGNGGAGCNLGYSSYQNEDAETLIQAFVNSPGHLATMLLETAEDIGVGVYKNDGVFIAMYIGDEAGY